MIAHLIKLFHLRSTSVLNMLKKREISSMLQRHIVTQELMIARKIRFDVMAADVRTILDAMASIRKKQSKYSMKYRKSRLDMDELTEKRRKHVEYMKELRKKIEAENTTIAKACVIPGEPKV